MILFDENIWHMNVTKTNHCLVLCALYNLFVSNLDNQFLGTAAVILFIDCDGV